MPSSGIQDRRIIEERKSLAKYLKQATQGEILAAGTFGPDDKPSSSQQQRARPKLKIEGKKGDYYAEIQGNPTRGKVSL